ncbi:MAG: CYTH domain-containing protein [Vicinamibacteria bacterium]|jgi:CYTH domain-containing protein
MEIERKFLVGDPPDLGGYESDPIEQGYLALADDEGGAEVRLRSRADRLTLTAKSAGGEVREEEEIGIDRDQFERLWRLTGGRRLAKRRYLIPYEGLTIELDVYAGGLAGLIVAEVEFADERAADQFVPPGWFGAEVTGKSEYLNETLATEGRPR